MKKMEKGLLQLLGKLPELKAGLKTVEDEDRLPESKLLPAIFNLLMKGQAFARLSCNSYHCLFCKVQ